MIKAYKYRIYPTDAQRHRIDNWISTCRFVYNLALETKINAWKSAGINLSAFDLGKQLKDLKTVDWIADVDSQAFKSEMDKLEKAYKSFFRGNGFPKFRKKSSAGSFSTSSNKREVNWEASTLTIPKIQNIPIKLSRRFEGKIKTVTISRSATGKYFASILVDNGLELPTLKPIKSETTIGIDVGIKSFVTTSNGTIFKSIRPLKDNLKRLKVLQQRASRKKKGSQNRRKANKKVALCHEKITNIRTDYIHKVTYTLTHDSQVDSIVIEDLNIVGMMKNHNLAQALNDVSLGEFYRQLKYKCEWNGINLIQIGRFEPSSKLCSVCNHKKDNLKLSDRIWTCGDCGTTHDRDFNASVNIKEMGLKNLKTGAGSSDEPVELSALAGAVKQEKDSIIVCNVVC